MLEQALQANTEAINRLCSLFADFMATKAVPTEATAATSEKIPPSNPPAVDTSFAQTEQKAAEPAVNNETLRKQCQALTLNLVSVDRTGLVEIFSGFKAKGVSTVADNDLSLLLEQLQLLAEKAGVNDA